MRGYRFWPATPFQSEYYFISYYWPVLRNLSKWHWTCLHRNITCFNFQTHQMWSRSPGYRIFELGWTFSWLEQRLRCYDISSENYSVLIHLSWLMLPVWLHLFFSYHECYLWSRVFFALACDINLIKNSVLYLTEI